jgi:hypothetical protein
MVINEMAHLLKDDLVFVCIAPIRLTRGAMADPERPAFSRSFLVSVVDVTQDLGEELGSFRKMVLDAGLPASSCRGRVSSGR